MYLHKEYLKIGENEIRLAISFNKNTRSISTGQQIDKGYRVSAVPVKRTKLANAEIEEFQPHTGFTDTLLSIERQNQKRLQEAIKILNERKEKYINWFKQNYNFTD